MLPMFLLAQDPTGPGALGQLDWRVAVLMFLCTSAGGAFQYLISQGLTVWRENRARGDAKEKGVVDHQAALIERLEREKREKEAEIDELQKQVQAGIIERANERVRSLSAEAHIRYLEGVMTRKGDSFEKYQPPAPVQVPGGTDTHKTLPPEGGAP